MGRKFCRSGWHWKGSLRHSSLVAEPFTSDPLAATKPANKSPAEQAKRFTMKAPLDMPMANTRRVSTSSSPCTCPTMYRMKPTSSVTSLHALGQQLIVGSEGVHVHDQGQCTSDGRRRRNVEQVRAFDVVELHFNTMVSRRQLSVHCTASKSQYDEASQH